MQSRQSLRLSGYDYSQNGIYFVTVCVHRHATLFGAIDHGVMIPNAIGRIIAEQWRRTAELRPYLSLDVFVVMPNHMHGIIAIVGEGKRTDQLAATVESVNRKSGKLQAGSLGAIIGRFKGSVPGVFTNCQYVATFRSGSATIMTISSETKSPCKPYENTLC